MQPPTSRALALVRAVMSTAVVLALAVGAHVLGGGPLPAASALAALAALVLAVMTLVGRRHLRFWTLAPTLGALQALLHGALTILPAGGVSTGQVAGHGAAAHTHASTLGVGLEATTSATVSAATGAASHTMPLTTGMLVAHALATLVTAVLLVGTDRAARAATHWATSVLPLLLTPGHPLTTTRVRSRVAAGPARVRRPLVARGSVARRGPPIASAAA